MEITLCLPLTYYILSSAIDLTFASRDIAIKCDWKVEDFNFGSDHFPIVI